MRFDGDLGAQGAQLSCELVWILRREVVGPSDHCVSPVGRWFLWRMLSQRRPGLVCEIVTASAEAMRREELPSHSRTLQRRHVDRRAEVLVDREVHHFQQGAPVRRNLVYLRSAESDVTYRAQRQPAEVFGREWDHFSPSGCWPQMRGSTHDPGEARE
jgi:hypothetical protein